MCSLDRRVLLHQPQMAAVFVHGTWEKHRVLAGNNSGQVPGDVPSDIVELWKALRQL